MSWMFLQTWAEQFQMASNERDGTAHPRQIQGKRTTNDDDDINIMMISARPEGYHRHTASASAYSLATRFRAASSIRHQMKDTLHQMKLSQSELASPLRLHCCCKPRSVLRCSMYRVWLLSSSRTEVAARCRGNISEFIFLKVNFKRSRFGYVRSNLRFLLAVSPHEMSARYLSPR
jgi:hypothetical protein